MSSAKVAVVTGLLQWSATAGVEHATASTAQVPGFGGGGGGDGGAPESGVEEGAVDEGAPGAGGGFPASAHAAKAKVRARTRMIGRTRPPGWSRSSSARRRPTPPTGRQCAPGARHGVVTSAVRTGKGEGIIGGGSLSVEAGSISLEGG